MAPSPNGQQALAVVSDVSKLEGCKAIVRRTIEQFGKIDILVNNAGSFPVALITDANYLETVELTTEILLKSVMRMTHLCANYLIATKGCIVNISSDGSGLSDPSVSAYCTCKAAVDKFTKCSAVELSPHGVRVNSVLPSLIDTPILDGFTAGALEKLKEHCNQSYPLRRYGQVEDIVGPVVFLSSPDAAFITGSNLPVDGGSLCVTSGSEWL
ncbi:3-oxoacyl-[acyl-carrier-protein] reductase FabG [Halotydeus destructor]|nr:3-oxoacyl-[acyl-carrier-protein] reductase FabG [Halotydeus destructor]